MLLIALGWDLLHWRIHICARAWYRLVSLSVYVLMDIINITSSTVGMRLCCVSSQVVGCATALLYCIDVYVCVCMRYMYVVYMSSAFSYGVHKHGASIGRYVAEVRNERLCSIAAIQTTPLSVLWFYFLSSVAPMYLVRYSLRSCIHTSCGAYMLRFSVAICFHAVFKECIRSHNLFMGKVQCTERTHTHTHIDATRLHIYHSYAHANT